MFEHVTDRLFWTLSAIIVGSLISVIFIKVFPVTASQTMHIFGNKNTYNIVDPKNRPYNHVNPSHIITSNDISYPDASRQVPNNYQ